MTRIKPLIAAALALGGTAIVPAAQAQRYWNGARYEQPYRGYSQPGYYRDGYDGGGYDRAYRGDYYRYDQPYRRCNSGTTGAVIGALAGGLLGHSIAGRGDHALGAVLGAGAGALAGRAVERSDNPGFCR